MADYYLDVNRGNDSNTGLSENQAWASITKLAQMGIWSSGDNILLASDSVWNISDRVLMRTFQGTIDNPITFSRYFSSGVNSGKPEVNLFNETQTTDWTWDAAESAWYWTQPQGYAVSQVSCILLGSNYQFASRIYHFTGALTAFTSDGEYDADTANKRIYLYTPGASDNPVDYYGGVRVSTEYGFRFTDTFNHIIVENIATKYSKGLLQFFCNSTGANDCNYTLRNCEGDTCSLLVMMTAQNAYANRHYPIIHDNAVTNTSHYGIWNINTHTWNAHVFNNTISNTGNSSTNGGGIYWGAGVTMTGDHNNRLYRNTISNAKHASSGQSFDGACVYVEGNTQDTKVYANKCSQSHHAFQDNSGGKTNFYGNLVKSCDVGIVITDQSAVGNTDVKFTDNVLIELTKDVYSNTGGGLGGIDSRVTSGTLVFQNNIITIAANKSMAGIAVKNDLETWTEDYNCIFGATNNIEDGDTQAALVGGTNSTNTEPVLDDEGRNLSGSACVGAGIKHWTGANPETYDEPKSNFNIDIGLQSSLSPFHPKNL